MKLKQALTRYQLSLETVLISVQQEMQAIVARANSISLKHGMQVHESFKVTFGNNLVNSKMNESLMMSAKILESLDNIVGPKDIYHVNLDFHNTEPHRDEQVSDQWQAERHHQESAIDQLTELGKWIYSKND
ncbi:hypothetical protein O9G_002338 [Rozella allomycis CSF55]|uniref:Uncharacterized protein n=1 Tax=Rozella allomycis (strain CSF55) TaxID=988480 RepID=A0A075B2F3_ROZAC|nr:hypothetical protein O9G_002338 [Rozella allomycis CSF55]|eukprot:EPZ36727.1 hypothetical protein O9G_002338 [Rozella allomycis CSF55]